MTILFQIPDVASIGLPDIITRLRSVPMTSTLFKSLDATYFDRFLAAQTEQEFSELREHLQYITRMFLPSYHLDDSLGVRQYTVRWDAVSHLCLRRVEEFRMGLRLAANTGS